MLLPKLSTNIKPKLTIQQRVTVKNPSNSLLSVNKTEKENMIVLQNNFCEFKKQNKIRSRSNLMLKRFSISNGSLETKKKEIAGKERNQLIQGRKGCIKQNSKSNFKLHQDHAQGKFTKQLSSNFIGASIWNLQRRNTIGESELNQNDVESTKNLLQTSENKSFIRKNTAISQKNHLSTIGSKKDVSEKQSTANVSFADFQNTKLIDMPEIRFRKAKRNTLVRRSRKYSRIIANNSLSMDLNVFSFQIDAKKSLQNCSANKSLLIKELVDDPDFEWKFTKYQEYAEKYNEYEIGLKQKMSTLRFLTQNLDILKERIAPFKSIKSLKQIVDILKPTLSQKEEYAHQIKMQMLEWKKKFFVNVAKIKESFNKNVEDKYETVFQRLHENEDSLQELLKKLDQISKKETEKFQKQDFLKLQQFLEPIVLKQKEIIDQIKICERDSDLMLGKFNRIEEEWSHVFDIFNSTLENCVNKCFDLSECIEKFYGRCSNAMFLTNGFEMENMKDQRILENIYCEICRWNQTKLKKIISENTLAKDHLQALKHLIAN